MTLLQHISELKCEYCHKVLARNIRIEPVVAFCNKQCMKKDTEKYIGCKLTDEEFENIIKETRKRVLGKE
jgi:hypothetical protein